MIDSWYVDHLVCPRDQSALSYADGGLRCGEGHAFPVVDGVPVMLLPDVDQTMALAHASLRQARSATGAPYYLDSVGVTDEERRAIPAPSATSDDIDPVVSALVSATNGNAYRHLIGRLREYPIPELRLPPGQGRTLLDIGCNWGRWCVAASRKRYRPIGIDPSLGAIMAARRVCRQLGLNARFVVGDGRFLPFAPATIDCVFSYSVLQHLSRTDAGRVVAEIGRVLKPAGRTLVQMPTKFGVRCLYHQARRGFRDGENFDVRYWDVASLRRIFATSVGEAQISVDCFFGIGLQAADIRYMPLPTKLVILASEVLRTASGFIRPLTYVADSVYVSATRRAS